MVESLILTQQQKGEIRSLWTTRTWIIKLICIIIIVIKWAFTWNLSLANVSYVDDFLKGGIINEDNFEIRFFGNKKKKPVGIFHKFQVMNFVVQNNLREWIGFRFMRNKLSWSILWCVVWQVFLYQLIKSCFVHTTIKTSSRASLRAMTKLILFYHRRFFNEIFLALIPKSLITLNTAECVSAKGGKINFHHYHSTHQTMTYLLLSSINTISHDSSPSLLMMNSYLIMPPNPCFPFSHAYLLEIERKIHKYVHMMWVCKKIMIFRLSRALPFSFINE